MKLVPSRSAALRLALVLSFAVAAGARSDEGMWMPRQIPELGPELKAAGMELDLARLADLTGDPMGAVVSLGGCTASFVSPEGLIVTNHHCVYGTVQFNSTPERDLITLGFLAGSRKEELPAAPGSYVYVTTGIRDVTGEVLGDPKSVASDAELARQVERRSRQLVDACEKPGGVRCNVARFYEGSLFLEITQMEIRDVRLVYAPAEGIGNFGGETDNWMWPRHTGDFGFLRAYVGPDGRPADPDRANVPYRPKHWLKVATRGVQEGDLVWIPGYPGRTFRYRTAGEVGAAREFSMPQSVALSREMIGLLEQENQRGKAVEIANYGRIRGFANSMKKYEGILLGMADGKVEAQRVRRESPLRAAAAADATHGDPVARIAELDAAERATRERDFVLDWLDRASPMYSQAFKLWRLAEERPRPDLDREEGYRERDLSRFQQGMARAQRSIEAASDRAGLRVLLTRAAALPEGQRIAPIDARLAATGRATDAERVEALLDELYAATTVADLAERKKMFEETTAQLAARHDSMVAFAAQLAPLAAARRERDDAFDGAMLRVRPTYLAEIQEHSGGRHYPDANSTLRFTYGRVTGYVPRDAVSYQPRTSLAGLVAKVTGVDPFVAPETLLHAAKSVPVAFVDPQLGSVPVDFLSTCDITGGNSGSPTLNGRGELVGLAFDGNWEGVVSDYLFDDEVVRTIHVDAVYIRWVMDEVDRAHDLLREMGLPVLTAD